MKKLSILFLTVLLLTGCEDENIALAPSLSQTELIAQAKKTGPTHAKATLSGDQEVPARETPAHGIAQFHLNKEGTELQFHLNVANIKNVVGAHIHLAPAGSNGGIVVHLFSAPAGGGPSNGLLSKGVITATDLTGLLAGKTLSDLMNEIEAGNAYVNVHTNDGVFPTNTGPGDFPPGEIRGQLSAK